MIPAEGADGIDNPVHFPQRHSVQQAVQLTEIRLDLVIVYAVCIVISFIEERQDRFASPRFSLRENTSVSSAWIYSATPLG